LARLDDVVGSIWNRLRFLAVSLSRAIPRGRGGWREATGAMPFERHGRLAILFPPCDRCSPYHNVMSDRLRVTPELVLRGYCSGLFPMGRPDGGLDWYSPDPRCIIELDAVHVPHTLRKTVRRGIFEIRINTAFDEVIRACGVREDGTWISPRIIRLYT